MKIDLTTKIKNLTFRNPMTVASGTFGVKDEYSPFINYEHLGAIITKTITLRPREGNPMPRICEVKGGMLNAIGLQNAGLEDFLRTKIPAFAMIKTPVIVNIAGESADEFREITRALQGEREVVKALEINLSCPNVEAGGVGFMRKRELMLDIMKAVRDETGLLVFAKLSPELGDVVEIAGDLVRAGADGFSLINTLRGMSVDIERRRSRLARMTGGLSGPAIKPIALRYVYEVKKALGVPVIASGGIMTAEDALEFLIAGADLLAVGTANFVNPHATMDILQGVTDYCRENGIRSVNELRGSLREE